METNMIGDAANNLERLTRFGDAAEIWLQHNEYAKAAPLFVKASSFVQAADCHHHLGKHSEAAAVLHQGEMYDEMVSYLCNNREDIPTDTFPRFNLLCKMLLKKNKISSQHRKAAIELLGSSAEQEAYFVEYEMCEPLAGLYLEQHRYKDLFDLLARTGQLEKALELATTKSLSEQDFGVPQYQMLKLLDYVWAGRSAIAFQQKLAVDTRSTQGFETPEMASRSKQWKASCAVDPWEASSMRQRFADLKNTMGKRFLSLQTILGLTAMSKESSLDDLPFEAVLEAIRTIKDLVLKSDGQAQSTILLVTGLWKFSDAQDKYLLLPWSPLDNPLTDIQILDAPRVAKQWILDKLASAMLQLDSMTREKWNQKWPSRCLQFLSVRFCSKKQRGEKCDMLHERVTLDECSDVFGALLVVNSVFCELSALYYRRIMKEAFQARFLNATGWNDFCGSLPIFPPWNKTPQ